VSKTRPKPAGNVRGLQRWIGEWAADSNESIARIQHRIALVVIAAMLDNASNARGESLFAVKGGSALELRYESAARASRDIDLAAHRHPQDAHSVCGVRLVRVSRPRARPRTTHDSVGERVGSENHGQADLSR